MKSKSSEKIKLKNSFIFSEYAIDLEFEAFRELTNAAESSAKCPFNYRPKELSLAVQYLAILNKNKQTLSCQKVSNSPLNLNPNWFDQLVFQFYLANLNGRFFASFIFLFYVAILFLVADFIQRLFYLCLTSRNDFNSLEFSFKLRLALSTVKTNIF